MEFHKSLAKYYIGWFEDCHNSAIYCKARGLDERAAQYLSTANVLLTIIMENWDAIEYFSVGDRAFITDSALPIEYRGYP
jgi:hypothetical protein